MEESCRDLCKRSYYKLRVLGSIRLPQK